MTETYKNSDIFTLPGWRLAELINKREVSEAFVTEVFIERITRLNTRLKAWRNFDVDYIWRQINALRPDCEFPLRGVPLGVKDVFNTEVLPTEMGSEVWRGHKAGNDARCVSYLRDNGAIVYGKTDTAEFAVHAPGQCINPWSESVVTGTSSGGSAVVVATAMAPVALATQTAGSTIRPASWCGVFGMKPSFGLIPRTGVLKTTDTLDNIGFYGRDGRDLRLLLDTMRVRGKNYPISERGLESYKKRRSHIRVGLVRGHLWDNAATYVHQALLKVASSMDLAVHISVEEVNLPDNTKYCHDLHSRIYDPCLAYYFKEELQNHKNLISNSFLLQAERGAKLDPSDYKSALFEQQQLAVEMEFLFENNDIDFLLHYSSNGSAPNVEPNLNMDLNLLWTLTWLPVVNIPGFFCPEKLPFGVQLIGPRYSDHKMLNFISTLTELGIFTPLAPLAPVSETC